MSQNTLYYPPNHLPYPRATGFGKQMEDHKIHGLKRASSCSRLLPGIHQLSRDYDKISSAYQSVKSNGLICKRCDSHKKSFRT